MSDNKQLDAALFYLNKCNFSIIPTKPDKKPFLQWQEWQKQKPPESVVRKWWGEQYKFANIAIITGKVSNLTVLDVDTSEGKQKLHDLLPDTFVTPIVDTPGRGEHLYCQYQEGVTNAVRFMPGCDIRSEGGYVIAPPSHDARGKWQWRDGCKIGETEINGIPDLVLSIIKSISTSNITSLNIARTVPNSPINLNEGTRDDTFFHIATRLIVGNTPVEEIEQILRLLNQIANPPFPEREILAKIQSAIKRSENREINLTQEVREWILSTDVHFKSTDVHKELGLSTRVHKKNVSTILKRFADVENLIEKDSNGFWRKIDRSFIEQIWWNDEGSPLPLKFPLGIGDFIKVYGGNVILLEGQKSQGKSAFALEFCRMNRKLFSQKILYQNVEMADSELIERFRSYGDVMTLDDWKESVTFIRQTRDWWDKIQPDALNVVDYLIEYQKSYLIADFIWQIHQKLKAGIALVIIQRDPFKPYGHGGRSVRDIPRAVISLIRHKVRLEDVKSFYQTAYGNPSGLCLKYKQVNWWEFRADGSWQQEEESKYQQFEKRRKKDED